jgi:hypothetical protein
MEYEPQTFFEEHEEDEVNGFTLLATDDSRGYHIAEKWERESKDSVWVDYWIPAEQFESRLDNGKCSKKATLTDEQFVRVCEQVGLKEEYVEED